MSRLIGKVVLITGASKGIGRALALGCAREGAHVIVNYHTDRAGAVAVAAEITDLGRRALVVHADIGRVAQIDRMFARAKKAFPRLDVLINNAGTTVDVEPKNFDAVKVEDWNRVFNEIGRAHV